MPLGSQRVTLSGFPAPVEVPEGAIAMFDTASLPNGWVLCDGNNGTPDLIDQFVAGPASDTTVGSGGGQDSYTVTETELPSHGHTGGTSSTDGQSHNHGTADITNYSNLVDTGQYAHFVDTDNRDLSSSVTNDGGGHTHTLSISTEGADETIDNRPSYHELVPAMKV